MKKKRIRNCLRGCLLAALFLGACVCTAGCGGRQRTITFNEHLDEIVLELDGQEYPLRELAFYVAYEEQLIQEQALAYDASNPGAYWNTHINGHFIRIKAREEAMDQAIHDLIFYGLAQELGMELDQEEIDYATGRSEDFWMNLGEQAQNRLGITKEELTEDLLRMALAQKYQQLYAAMNNVPEEDYDASGAAYETLLGEHTYKIRDRLWEEVSMGHVTLDQ
ncbi:MAG: hypothetical protein PUK75_03675 [bacterium]|nr:hypothetical protein [bacterium]MDY4100225.1 hypothetical protein [Lachnospiraceae bacterium]